jgi:hypothetical protein
MSDLAIVHFSHSLKTLRRCEYSQRELLSLNVLAHKNIVRMLNPKPDLLEPKSASLLFERSNRR